MEFFRKKSYFKCYDSKYWNNCVIRFTHTYIRDFVGIERIDEADSLMLKVFDMKYYEFLLDGQTARFPNRYWERITHDEFRKLRGRGYKRIDENYFKIYK